MSVPWSSDWKRQKLSALWGEWENCQKCLLCKTRNKMVFGEGNPDADIMLIREAPGAEENKSGSPFTGISGELLKSMFSNVGADWDDLFVTNVVACHPPENRDPTKDEKEACLSRLQETIYLIDPLLIVTVGKYALNALVGGRSWGIESEQGKLFSSPSPQFRISGERNGAEIPGRAFPKKWEDKSVFRLEYDVVPILHPAYILRVDSYDSQTETFSPGGAFDNSMNSLEAIMKRIEQLKSKHAKISRLLERI